MKRVSLLALTVLFSCMYARATMRTQTDAAQIAAQWLNSQSSNSRRAPMAEADMQLVFSLPLDNGETAIYVFNGSNGGFAVVAGDDKATDILCYSAEGSLDEQNMPAAMRWWLGLMAEEVSAIAAAPQTTTARRAAATETTVIEPLLGDILWTQSEPFNNLCPIDNFNNTRSVTGCVATAAAQIMRYWKHPHQGTGKKTYTWYNYDRSTEYDPYKGTYAEYFKTEDLTADFGNTIYNWDDMPAVYKKGKYTETQANAVATLMYHCGIACDMYYGCNETGGSGALVGDMANGMRDYFGYKFSRVLSAFENTSLTFSDFANAFNTDLEAGRPIIISGEDPVGGGHAFVCDGRDKDGKFHINWGWAGHGNCYTAISALRPESDQMPYSFTQNIEACIGLEPACKTVRTTDIRTVCINELPFTWNDIEIRSTADNGKEAWLKTTKGCDSIVTLQLTVYPTYNTTDGATICENELPYTWEGETFTAAGSKTKTLKTINGCDSIVTFTLTVYTTYDLTDGATICENELPYTWEGETFNAAGTKTKTLKTINGCDSIVTFTLTVYPTYDLTDGATICENELPYIWQEETFNAAGSKTKILKTITGCDSVVTFTLTVYPTYNTTDGDAICENELPYTWEGETFNAAGTKTKTLKTINGCDSVVTFTLTVNPTYNTTDGSTIYDYELPYKWEGVTFTAAGTETRTLTSSGLCDSTVTFTLTVIPTVTLTAEANNSGFGYIDGDGHYTSNETATLTATANSGYKFVRWSNGSKTNPYIFTITEDTYLRAIFAENSAPDANITTQTESDKVVFTWTAVKDANTYTLVIYLDDLYTQIFCTLVFDNEGRLLSQTSGKPKQAPAASAIAEDDILRYEADFLASATTYYYMVQTQNVSGRLLDTEYGTFVTEETSTAIPSVSGKQGAIKLMINGRLYIMRNSIIYDISGQRAK
ncbi:MAG: C10 family peptidase [Paludibacteraceae bacterium]|nr:C10 family peptidase [Paludibacteraceae bacterium]